MEESEEGGEWRGRKERARLGTTSLAAEEVEREGVRNDDRQYNAEGSQRYRL